MPAPLAKPLIVTIVLPIRIGSACELRKGVGGHDRVCRLKPMRRQSAGNEAVHHAGEGAGLQRSPMTPVEEDILRLAAHGFEAMSAVN